MIPLLRAGAFVVNAAIFAGVPWLLGASVPVAVAIALVLFAATWWACARVPRSDTAPPGVQAEARDAARIMRAPAPRFVRSLPGWTAAAVRAGRGYGLLLGDDVAPEHRRAVLAHEIAHYTTGDLHWEPFTDGPARLFVHLSRSVPPLLVMVFPFCLVGAPLAHATELRADRLAADAISGYAAVLKQVAPKMGPGATLLYPSLARRIRHSARNSNGSG